MAPPVRRHRFVAFGPLSTGRYLGIDVDDALELAEQTDL